MICKHYTVHSRIVLKFAAYNCVNDKVNAYTIYYANICFITDTTVRLSQAEVKQLRFAEKLNSVIPLGTTR